MEEGFKHGPWKVLEFYSGIGGLRYSIERACVNAEIVEAFDVNDKANDVYEYNFRHRPYQGNIQSLTADVLDSYKADTWLLSPPCQPYTRQGLQKHSRDVRASSFLKILELLPHILHPPFLIFVENVVGFEMSDTHGKMVEILEKIGFFTQEFILSPLQFSVPYSRPRYFCLAKRKPLSFRNPLFNKQILCTPSLLFENAIFNEHEACDSIEKFLEFQIGVGSNDSEKCYNWNGCSESFLEEYLVPLSLIERWGNVMDIVYPDSKRCCCFTKSYYRYVKGTGSILSAMHPEKNSEVPLRKEQCLRYFTPREVANLHCFPEDFSFPPNISLKQRYALLGNSLSVAVVTPLLQYLFSEP